MKAPVHHVAVRSPARLHLGFLDLNAPSGRRFGSVGLTLEWPAMRLIVERGDGISITGEPAARAESCVRRLAEQLGLPPGCRMQIVEAIPEHVGLGSGTQLAIAVGIALTRLHGLDLTARQVAALVARGQRSGIGIGAFESGGFLVDGGRGDREEPPPILARAAFPDGWRILLMLDPAMRGLHGESEAAAFQALNRFPEGTSARICRLVLMQALPALHERDLAAFAGAIGELQRITGDHFAPAQGGRFVSRAVSDVLEWLRSQGIEGVGQSSWGPTGFAILGSAAEARSLAAAAQTRWGRRLEFKICSARNRGGEIEIVQAMRSSAGR
jgi:beta-RFAP synthase